LRVKEGWGKDNLNIKKGQIGYPQIGGGKSRGQGWRIRLWDSKKRTPKKRKEKNQRETRLRKERSSWGEGNVDPKWGCTLRIEGRNVDMRGGDEMGKQREGDSGGQGK